MYSHFNIYFRLNVGGVLPVRPLCAPSCELMLALGFLTTFQLNVSTLCCSAATSATTDRYHRSLVSACYKLFVPDQRTLWPSQGRSLNPLQVFAEAAFVVSSWVWICWFRHLSLIFQPLGCKHNVFMWQY